MGTRVVVTLSEDENDWVRAMAKEDGRSVSSWLRRHVQAQQHALGGTPVASHTIVAFRMPDSVIEKLLAAARVRGKQSLTGLVVELLKEELGREGEAR